MALVEPINTSTGDHGGWIFWCPGCEEHHLLDTRWTKSGTDKAPTFAPSLVTTVRGTKPKKCHLFVREGKLQFLGDCSHSLAGKTVDMEELEP